jgi:PAS domain S-box-containing protein
MQNELRDSGIDVIGSIPWGTHFCQFYKTKQDLIDILVPYFKAGLENNEFCMWVTSEPLMIVEVQETMREAVEDFDEYLRNGQIEVISYQDWYLLGGTFDDDRVLRGWVSKLERALARGFSGLRLTGNTLWLERNHWHAFTEYEAKVNDLIGRYRMLAICTYSLDKCDGAAVIDVVRNHQFALIKQEGRWDIIESAIYKQAKEALRKSEQDLNRAQAVAQTGSWRLDVWRNQLLWSDETHRIFGIPKGTPMTYETFLSSVHPQDREYVDRKWTAALHGEPYDIEHRITVGDEIRWVREKAELEFDSQGSLKGGFGTAQDITERKRLENELRVTDYAIASAISGVAIADLEGSVIYANLACLSMWDYEEEEVLGKHVTAFFANITEAEAAMKAILEEEAWQGEAKAKRRDGSALDVQVSANLVTDADGEPVCMMASFVDITEMKIIQEALKREDQIRRTIMENTGTQLAYLDTKFDFVMVNSAYAKGSGHTEEELIGKNHFALFPNEENRAIFEQVRDTGEPVVYYDKPFEFVDQSERGITYWDWTLTPIKDFSGKVQGLVLSLIETTERKKVEELKDSFIGMVSHELRTPLTVLIGSLHTAMIPGMAEEEKRRLVEDALWEASSLSRLLENLLELSRYQAKRLELMKEPVAIDRCMQKVVNNLSRMSPLHKLILEVPGELPLTELDQIRVERILYNLIENAIKYSPGGEIRISAVKSEDQIVIAVSDQGPGIPPESLPNLFQRFERLTESSTNPIRGLGLGLYVCRLLVEAHGGRIWAESEPGKGSTFYFTLPVSS